MNFDSKNKIYISPRPLIEIPTQRTLTEFVLDTPHQGQPLNHSLFTDAITNDIITHQQLREYIPKLASGLYNKYDIKEGNVVAMFAPNHIHYATCMLAITSLGAIISPVNYVYTSSEVKHLLEQSNPKVLFTIPELYDTAKKAFKSGPLSSCKIVFLSSKSSQKYEEIPTFNQILCDKEYPKLTFSSPTQSKKQIAAILFSSGTTGIPKGVMLSHYNLVANLMQVEACFREHYQPKRRFVAVLPFFHCYAMMTDMLTICRNLCSSRIMNRFDLPMFLDILQKDAVPMCFVAPPIIVAIVKHPIVSNYNLSTLKYLLSGAAPLSKDLEMEIKSKFNISCVQLYGMSEMSPVSHAPVLGKARQGSVGFMVPNMTARIVDIKSGKPLGPNQRGELRMTGPNILMGYYRNEEATREIFDLDGFMKTGDIAYCDDEGYFYVVDRLKELIKVKGFQVPPAELEAILLTHPKVADACVIGIPNEIEGEVPKGYIVLKDPNPAINLEIIEDVKNFVHAKVAHYKRLKGGLEIIDQIPKSASGKILRRQLVQLNNKAKL